MINYAPMLQSEYCLNLSFKSKMLQDTVWGIGDKKHVPDPALWNLLVITSKLPYLFEDPKVKKAKWPISFVTLDQAKEDMGKFIGGRLIGDMVRTLDPMQFLEAAVENDIGHLSLSKFFKSESGLRSVIRARAYTWALANGVPVPTNAKAIVKMISEIEK